MTSHVLIIGAGAAGLLAAAAVAPFFETVTVVERDVVPETAAERRGVPQARHPHLMMPGGAAMLEKLLPGVTDRLVSAGAHRIRLNSDLVSLTAGGWMNRYGTLRVGLSCSRQLLDHILYDKLSHQANVSFRSGTEPIRLIGDRSAVRGAELLNRSTAATELVAADIVIDASGRGSTVRHWLHDLSIAEVTEQRIDSGHTYSTRLFRAPAGAESGFPVVMILPDPATGNPGGNALLAPVENGHWLVTLGATRGLTSPKDDGEFDLFARHHVRHPLISELLLSAEPVSEIRRSHSTYNRRYRRAASLLPHGLLLAGDSAAAFNPVYGHGLSFAARCAEALRRDLNIHGPDPTRTRSIQRAITRASQMPWLIATSQDCRYRNTFGPTPGIAAKLLNRFGDRFVRTAAVQPTVASGWVDIMSLSRSVAAMTDPRFAIGALLGPRKPAVANPPLTPDEQQFVSRKSIQ